MDCNKFKFGISFLMQMNLLNPEFAVEIRLRA
jgi:hypothetical protein